MLDYFFIFGTHPSLSVAELVNYFINNGIKHQVKFMGPDFMVVSLEYEPKDITKRLGGLVKYGRVVAGFAALPSATDLQKVLLPYINREKKFYCGFSYYPQKGAKSKARDLFRLGLSLKTALKSQGLKVRLVSSKEINLSSVVISKNKLLTEQGAEAVMLKTTDKLMIGRTMAVQDFASLSFRDYSRPSRDDRSGMLPPKLAQMMINIAASKDKVLLDPFCGSGTILQEALLLGFNKVIGFDQSAKAVKDSEQNLSWLRDKYGINIDKVEIERVDVRRLSKKLAGQRVDVIVTEPDLGSPRLQAKQVDREKQRLEKLYSEAGQEFFKVLKPGGRVVMVWPVFFGKTYLELEQKIKRIGFVKIKPIADNLNQIYPLNSRGNLEYYRSGQRVGREITIWTKSD